MDKKLQLVDLTLPIEEGMITYPSSVHQRFKASIVGRIDVEGRETRKFTMGSHCGTHVDAMRHFNKKGKTIDQLPLETMVGEATLINLGTLNPGSEIRTEDLKSNLPKYLKRAVIQTDWSRFWNSRQYYQDWPYFKKDAT